MRGYRGYIRGERERHRERAREVYIYIYIYRKRDLGCLNNKDYSILGSILRSPIFEKYHLVIQGIGLLPTFRQSNMQSQASNFQQEEVFLDNSGGRGLGLNPKP